MDYGKGDLVVLAAISNKLTNERASAVIASVPFHGLVVNDDVTFYLSRNYLGG